MPFIPPGGVPPTPDATASKKGKLKLTNELGGTADSPTVAADHGGTHAIGQGGTGQTTQQAAINALTNVSGATDEHVLTKDTATGNAIFKAAAGGGGNNDLLDGSVHQDTVAQTVTRGSLIYGNATPKWDELVVGPAYSVLTADGTDVSWSAAPRLANIADTGGTNRITMATSSPHVTLTGNVKISSSNLGVGIANDTNTTIYIGGPTIGSTNYYLRFATNAVTLETSQTLYGMFAAPTVNLSSSSTGHLIRGLHFMPALSSSGGNSATTITGIYAGLFPVFFTGTVGTWHGLRIAALNPAGGSPTFTTTYGIKIENQGHSSTTTAYGLKIDDVTAGTNKYVIEAGPSTPYLRVVGNFTAAANATPVYISEGATPTLRQLKTKAGNTLGAGDLVCVLV